MDGQREDEIPKRILMIFLQRTLVTRLIQSLELAIESVMVLLVVMVVKVMM